MSWFRRLMDRRHIRRSTRDGDMLVLTATSQIDRAAGDLSIDGSTALLQSEMLILSGVKQAIARAVEPHADSVDKLAANVSRELAGVTAARTAIDSLETTEHVVTIAHGGRSKKDSGSFPGAPELAGDTLPTTSARTEHERLSAQIERESNAGSRRHSHGVGKLWVFAAHALLFLDILALFALTIRVENATFDPKAWRDNPFDQAQSMATALGFAAIAAAVLALGAHTLGKYHWQWLHRAPAEQPRPTGWGSWRQLTPVLSLGWLGLALFGMLAGVTIYKRIQVQADGTAFADLAPLVGLLIAVAAAVSPLLVAIVVALQPSPEVLRRNALARIVAGVDARHRALDARISAHNAAVATLIAQATREQAKANRAAQLSVLPAAQAIVTLRAKHGYAGELYQGVPLLSVNDRPEMFDGDELQRIREDLEAMRSAAAHQHTSTLVARQSRHEDHGLDNPDAPLHAV